MNLIRFTGPIFIVGMPRSGTKLLRDLIKQNPKIGIPSSETNFIPYMINLFGNPPRFEDNKEFNRFYEELKKTYFWVDMEKMGLVLSKDNIDHVSDKKSWSSILEFIIRFYASQGRSEYFIWGDKSPTYLVHMKLLKDIFQEAKFIHIIRDPRDCCLSAKKVWGTNIYRTAELWRQRLEIGRADGRQLGEDYMEVLYENLLDEPEKTMISVCTFLGCKFITAMTELSKPSENLGDAKGQARILKENKNKYLFELSPSEIRRIEEIVYPIAKNIPYNFEYDIEFKPLNPLMLKILTFYDGIAWLRFFIREKNLSGIIHWYRTVMRILAGRMSVSERA